MEQNAKTIFCISGRVIDRETRRGVTAVRVEAWDKDLIFNDLIGSNVTTELGAFQIEFDDSYFRELFLDRQPDIFFKLFQEDKLIQSTEDAVLWNIKAADHEITIEIDAPTIEQPDSWLKINSFNQLIEHEKEILERIANTPNGGNLFMIHPFMLLADIGVELSEQACAEIMKHETHLSGLSAVPYNALKASKEEQRVRFHVKGLFERREQ